MTNPSSETNQSGRPEETLSSERAPEPVGAYPHAKRVGNLLFLSGVGPRKRGTKEIPGVTLDEHGRITEVDIEAQCRSCFDNVAAILAALQAQGRTALAADPTAADTLSQLRQFLGAQP